MTVRWYLTVSWRVSHVKGNGHICTRSNFVNSFQLLFRNGIDPPTQACTTLQVVVINWKRKQNAASLSLLDMLSGSMCVVFRGNQVFHLVIGPLSGIEMESCHGANCVALPSLWAVFTKTCNTTSDDNVVTVSTFYLQCSSSDNVWCRKIWHSGEFRIIWQCIAIHVECWNWYHMMEGDHRDCSAFLLCKQHTTTIYIYICVHIPYTSSVIGCIYNGSVIQYWRSCTPSCSIGECAVPGLNAILCFLWFTNCVLLFDNNLILGCLWHWVFV